MKKIFTFCTILFVTFAFNANAESKYPKSARDKRDEKIGSVLDNKDSSGGFTLFGGGKNSGTSAQGIGANVHLWKASLEVVSFMPISISDSAGGVITTEWSEDLDHPGERYKINVLIKSSDLKAHSLKVTVFKQTLRDNIWRDVKPNAQLAQDIEDKILTKARSLKLAQEH